MADLSHSAKSTVIGIYLAVGSFLFFAMQDAAVKWLVAFSSVPQILFVRSLTLVVMITLWKGWPIWRELRHSPEIVPLLGRGVLLLTAWMCFYNAARHLQLAELTVIYYGAPLIVTILSIPVLGEKVPASRWLATAIGFAGVITACLPHDASQPWYMALAGVASCLWACSMLLMRSMAQKCSSQLLMASQNILLLVATAAMAPFFWHEVPWFHIIIMVLVGVGSGAGQFMMFEAAKRAPASVVAPMEYTSLLWAFSLGFLIWGDIPAITVFIGGGLIILSGMTMLLTERYRQPPIS